MGREVVVVVARCVVSLSPSLADRDALARSFIVRLSLSLSLFPCRGSGASAGVWEEKGGEEGEKREDLTEQSVSGRREKNE